MLLLMKLLLLLLWRGHHHHLLISVLNGHHVLLSLIRRGRVPHLHLLSKLGVMTRMAGGSHGNHLERHLLARGETVACIRHRVERIPCPRGCGSRRHFNDVNVRPRPVPFNTYIPQNTTENNKISATKKDEKIS